MDQATDSRGFRVTAPPGAPETGAPGGEAPYREVACEGGR